MLISLGSRDSALVAIVCVREPGPVTPYVRRRTALLYCAGRRTTAKRVRQALASHPRLADRDSLATLLHLLEIGCHSQLEISGYEQIFSGAGMPEFRRQVPMRLGGRMIYLDVFAEQEMVNFELDGRAGH
jgi:hypothetical protein